MPERVATTRDQSPLRILVSVFLDVRWGRSFVRGVAEFGRTLPQGWMVFPRSTAENFPKALNSADWDGVIVHLVGEEDQMAIERTSCPVILVDPRPGVMPDYPRILFDHSKVGYLAAKHLLETGRRHFAFFGFEGAKLSEEREASFLTTILKAGFPCPVTRIPIELKQHRTRAGEGSRALMRASLGALPRPAAIGCGNDELSRILLELCLELGLSVPEDVALIGGDNDDLFCRTSQPSLSSVSLPFMEAGQEAAAVLQKLMLGGQPPSLLTLIEPNEVVARDSTRVVPGEDRAVEAAVRMLHTRFADVSLRMPEVAAAAKLSVSSLERRFQASLGCTPLIKLRDIRLSASRRLLAETDKPVAEIAQACGYGSSSRFGAAFRELTGVSPLAYRRDSIRQSNTGVTPSP